MARSNAGVAVNALCLQCGRTPVRVRGRSFCSNVCRGAWTREHRQARRTTVEPGLRSGRLVVVAIDAARDSRKQTYWTCRCDCGVITSVRSNRLIGASATRSCGCVNSGNVVHGMYRDPIYHIWGRMVQRCHLKCPSNRYYRDRGIVVCDEWRHDFAAFRRDMGDRPSLAHSIDRIDNNGPYAPWNCRWATDSEQAENKRTTNKLTKDGQTYSVAEWARRLHIGRWRVYKLAARGWFDVVAPGSRGMRLARMPMLNY